MHRYGALVDDPRNHGMSEEHFRMSHVVCPALGGTQIQRRDRCPDRCEGFLDERCPRRRSAEEGDGLGMAGEPTPGVALRGEDDFPVAPKAGAQEPDILTDADAPEDALPAPPDCEGHAGAVAVEVNLEVAPEIGSASPTDLLAGVTETQADIQDPDEGRSDVQADHLELEVVDGPHDTELDAEIHDNPHTSLLSLGTIQPGEPSALLMAPPLDLAQAIAHAQGSDIDPAEVDDEQIASWIVEAANHAQHGLARAVLVGRSLTARKATLRHGQFGPWLDSLGLSRRTGRLYMQLADAWTQNGNALPFSQGVSINEALHQIRKANKSYGEKADVLTYDEETTAEAAAPDAVDDVGTTIQAPEDGPATTPDLFEEEAEMTDAERVTSLLRSVVEIVADLPLKDREQWLPWLHDYLLPEKAGLLEPRWRDRDVEVH